MVLVIFRVHLLTLAHDCLDRCVLTARVLGIMAVSHRFTTRLRLRLHPHQSKRQHALSKTVVSCDPVRVHSQAAAHAECAVALHRARALAKLVEIRDQVRPETTRTASYRIRLSVVLHACHLLEIEDESVLAD